MSPQSFLSFSRSNSYLLINHFLKWNRCRKKRKQTHNCLNRDVLFLKSINLLIKSKFEVHSNLLIMSFYKPMPQIVRNSSLAVASTRSNWFDPRSPNTRIHDLLKSNQQWLYLFVFVAQCLKTLPECPKLSIFNNVVLNGVWDEKVEEGETEYAE